MFWNYLKVTWRNIKRYKGYSFINIIGLAVGLACCILILLWVQDELSYDRFHSKADDLYRAVKEYHKTEPATHYWPVSAPLAPALKENYPEIIKAARFTHLRRGQLVKYGEKSLLETQICLTDPDFFEMFTFPLLQGDPASVLSNPNSLVISEEMATKYFGSENPLGKTLNINNEYDFTVTGIMKNVPHNSHLKFDFLVPFIRIEDFEKEWAVLDNWTLSGFATYVLLKKNTSLQELNHKIKDFILKHVAQSKDLLYLQPLKDIHLYSSHIQFGIEGQGNIKYVYIFSVVAFFVLIIACINFMNLATARSSNRAKEVGLRKVVGARRPQLMGQFFYESVLMALLSLILAVVLVELFLPAFRDLSGKPLDLGFSSNINVLLAIVVMTLITGFLSGTYPALFLSSLRPVKVLKGRLKTEGRGYLFRKILVVSQFSLSILLIICTILVSIQVDYMRNRKLGLDKEQVVYLPIRSEQVGKYDSLKIELLKRAGIRNVAASSNIPTYGVILTLDYITWEGKDPEDTKVFHATSTGYDFIETLNMEIIQGRSFSEEYPADENAVVINETAQKLIGMENPVGKRLMLPDSELPIIGIVKDYHFRSLHSEIEPLLLINAPSLYRYILIKLDSGDIPSTLANIESTWKTFFPDTPFEYHFLDEAYGKLYRTEQQMGTLFNYFTGLAILISCLGLFGLASFMAEKRTKEIGIRKVLGAPVSGVVILLNKEFIKWVLIANIFAWPVAYYAMSKWLQGFAYRTKIEVWSFALAALIALAIAVVTVSYKSIKAATANPVESLRYE
ncbi:MAG: FtsX-like permease family protein [Candidatus Aminicenantes bacterium]|nr:FtsX-like permease family protein [Candidatus Aminicenantes bacterium]